jgi:hypothetical protein
MSTYSSAWGSTLVSLETREQELKQVEAIVRVRVRVKARVRVRVRASAAIFMETELQIISLENQTLQVRGLNFWSPLWHLANKLSCATIPALFQLIWCVQPCATSYKSLESIHTVI